jgi:hypothetical protein
MRKLAFTVLTYLNTKQVESYARSHQHLDIIFVLHESIKIGLWNKCQELIIDYTSKLLEPLIQNHLLNNRMLFGIVTAESKPNSIYKLISISFQIDKSNYYSLKLVYHTDDSYQSLTQIVLSKLGIQGEELPIYQYSINCSIPETRIYNDDKFLGFFKPEAVRLRIGLCYSCEYFGTNYSQITCAVHPSTDYKTCFYCMDYQLKTGLTEEEYELNYKYNQ